MREIWVVVFVGLFSGVVRLILSMIDRQRKNDGNIEPNVDGQVSVAIAQTTGNREIQADQAQFLKNSAGIMAVLADGIGNKNTGRVCAQLAVDTVLDRFEPYHVLQNPEYFFKTSFYEANCRIQKTIGDRMGGASVGTIFLSHSSLYYALAGDIRIAVLRHGELIPLSKGQTMDVLAVDAWEKGKITRQDALWSMEEKRIWNYVGIDGFHAIEICEPPVQLKNGDLVFMASRGIFEELSWGEIEDILVEGVSLQETAEKIVWTTEAKVSQEKDNGSVVLIKVRME